MTIDASAAEESFDVIVIGAGVAGLCCAAELTLKGLRPLLVCETKEVGYTLRSEWVDGNRGLMQHPAWQVAWGGGWWYQLVRELNIPVQIHVAPPINFTVSGSGVFHEILPCASASAVMEMMCKVSPLPLDDVKDDFEKILYAGMAHTPEELYELASVPLTAWLDERGADALVSHLFIALVANICESTPDMCREHLSVFGAFAMLRSFLCGEGALAVVLPDARDGLCIPLGHAVEERGGAVWRGQKVDEVIVEDGRATGVRMADGRVARAPHVAIAAGNPRIPALFAELPADAVEPIEYSAKLQHRDFCTMAVLNKDVVTLDRYVMVSDELGNNIAWVWPLHSMAPWTTQPGKQFVLAQAFYTPETVEEAGGREAIYERMHDEIEKLYPGYRDAIETATTQEHKHHWMGPLSHGPKLPRRSASVEGVWFVGDGSAPLLGVGVEAAASAGVMGARAIAEIKVPVSVG